MNVYIQEAHPTLLKEILKYAIKKDKYEELIE